MRIISGLLILFFALAACNRSDYPGYKKVSSGLHFRLHTVGNAEKQVASGRLIDIRMIGQTLKDEIIFDETVRNIVLDRKKNDEVGGIEEALRMLFEGDSATFLFKHTTDVDRYLPPELIPDTLQQLKLTLSIQRVLTPKEIEEERRHQAWLNDKELEEQKELGIYLEKIGVARNSIHDGIYYREVESGKGELAQSGNTVYVHYKGYFVDSTLFDSTYDLGNPLEFVLGDPDQVIKGMDAGIRRMREGGKAIFIIPSQSGFGERGSSTGIIPPFTSLIYEVKLVKIR